MSRTLQFSKRLQAPAPLSTATGIKKTELRAHRLGQLTAVKELVAFEQLANVSYVRRLRGLSKPPPPETVFSEESMFAGVFGDRLRK